MLLPRALAVLVLSAAPLLCQDICYQENGGPGFNDAVFNGPNGTNAVKLTLAAPLVVEGAQVFTGESPGAAMLAIWSHDALLDQPAAKLAQASFTVVAADGWQGGAFHAPLPLAAGTYWVAWTLPFVAQSSIDTPKQSLGQVYRTSIDGGASWFGPFQFNNNHFKFRLLGDFGPCAGFTVAYGSGTPGADLPTLLAGGGPCAGHVLQLAVGHAPPLAPAVLTIGLGTGVGLVKGCTLQDLPLAAVTVPFQIGADGTALLAGELPASVLPGVVNVQALISDPAAAQSVSATNPVQITLG